MINFKKTVRYLIVLLIILFIGIKIYRKLSIPKMEFQNLPLTTIENNLPYTLSNLKDTVVIVSFFQTWCIDCVKETPSLNDLGGLFNTQKFKIIYISDEDKNLIRNFQSRFNSPNILFTQSQTGFSSLGISAYPTTYLINKNGETVLAKQQGYEWLKEKLNIEKLLGK